MQTQCWGLLETAYRHALALAGFGEQPVQSESMKERSWDVHIRGVEVHDVQKLLMTFQMLHS